MENLLCDSYDLLPVGFPLGGRGGVEDSRAASATCRARGRGAADSEGAEHAVGLREHAVSRMVDLQKATRHEYGRDS